MSKMQTTSGLRGWAGLLVFSVLAIWPGLPLGDHSVHAQTTSNYRVGDRIETPKSSRTGGFELIRWEDLSPKDWDPFAAVRDLNLATLKDNDPRAIEALAKLIEARNNAPVVPQMEGKVIRLSGFLVPVSKNKDDVLEFLLVPYFGACIHTPPPPANMVIFVVPSKPYRSLTMMDAVTVTGQLSIVRTDSPWGVAGYKLAARQVERYVDPASRGAGR